MNFTIDASTLKASVDKMAPGSRLRETDPRATSISLEARGKGVIELTTTLPGDRWEIVRIPGQKVEETGRVTLNYARLKSVLRAMRDDTIEVSTVEEEDESDKRNQYSRTWVRISSGATTVSLRQPTTEPMPSTPSFTDPQTVSLHVGALQEAHYFTSQDEYRPILATVLYDEGSYVSTDSYRLSVIEVPERSTDLRFMIPRETALALGRLFGNEWVEAQVEVRPYGNGGMLEIQKGEHRLVARLAEGDYVNYKSLVPTMNGEGTGGMKFTKDLRDAALKAHRLIGAMSIGDWGYSAAVTVEQEGDRLVMSWRGDGGKLRIESIGTIKTQKVGFNPRFLADLFRGTNVDTMFGTDSIKPWGLEEKADYCEGAKRTRLLMPVRISL